MPAETQPISVRTTVDKPPISRLQVALWLIASLCIFRYWILPLPSSFWIDETGTAFVVHFGGDHPSFAVAPQVPASIYYVLPKIAEKIGGFSEITYRIPSVLLMIVALFLIFEIATKLIHPDAGWLAIFACLSLRAFNYEADDARPYALGTCLAAASLSFLIRWFDDSRWRNALLFVVCAALLWRTHLIYWPFYFVLALYAVFRIGRPAGLPEDFFPVPPPVSRVTRWQVAAVFSVLGLLLIPVAIRAVEISRNAGAHVITTLPHLSELSRQMHLGMVVAFLLVGNLIAYWLKWRPKRRVTASTVALVLGWWMCQPVLLYAYSWLTGNSVYVTRYLSLSLPGTGLAVALVLSFFIPRRMWKPLALAVGIYVLVFFGGRWSWNPRHHNSEWRGIASKINNLHLPPDTPILLPSPYIEAQSPVWKPAYQLPGFLYSHLQVYPLNGKQYLFPFKTSPEAEAYAAELAANVLSKKAHFVIYGGDANVWLWQGKLHKRPELRDWKWRPLSSGSDVDAVVFEAPDASAAQAAGFP